MTKPVESCAWPASRLPDLLSLLLDGAGLLPSAPKTGADRYAELKGTAPDPGEWIPWAAKAFDCEAARSETTLAGFRDELAFAYPAILRISGNHYVGILRADKRRLRILAPDSSKQWVGTADVYETLCRSAALPQQAEIERLLAEAGIPDSRRAKTVHFFVQEELNGIRFRDCWMFRSAPGTSTNRWLKQTNIVGHGAGLAGAYTCQYLLWIASWAIMGQLSFEGHFDSGWRLAWALLLVTSIPLRLLATWKQGLLVAGFGGLLKRRLLHGAMQLNAEEMRQNGIGKYMSQALEAEAVESLALNGGVGGALSLIELAIAALVLQSMSLVLLAWFIVACLAGWRYFGRYKRWTGARLGFTDSLVESMIGQRTRLVQQQPEQWHEGEDRALLNYAADSRSLDRLAGWLTTAIPRGWLVIALACFSPSVISAGKEPGQLAVTFGGILLAYAGFKRLTGASADIAVFLESFKQIRTLFQAAARAEPSGEAFALGKQAGNTGDKIMEADGIGYRYRPQGEPVLEACSLTIARGDRILLEGPSGGGKTTLASILSGLREPNTGLLLANGLDRHARGPARWRRQIATAPQFHENHIFTETLAFNLLMGRGELPTEGDLKEAETVCRELGLGDLLDRMPAGILQMVGEGGWQLSHGERSRVFIARALLQPSELVILDESFGALDPESLQIAMECTLNRAETLMVIAHP
ncbi:MAG TPA: ABC transporter ATP-binding protein [Bryobacteraceae bacterium]|nr:ABC transporter ATP-binding protein [Bryobacteraceae bacterium]